MLPPTRHDALEYVRGLVLDVLVYPEIGMDAGVYFMAFTRLAPVQMVFWGHPVSQGHATIDYFVSSDLYEKYVDHGTYGSLVLGLNPGGRACPPSEPCMEPWAVYFSILFSLRF